MKLVRACSHCNNTVDVGIVHSCHEYRQKLDKGSNPQVPDSDFYPIQNDSTFGREGDHFIHQVTGVIWSQETVDEITEAFKLDREQLRIELAKCENERAELQEETINLKAQLVAVSKRLDDSQASYQDTLQDNRELAKENKKLSNAVDQLKAILFQKELAISQNSGYIARVRELDTPVPERLVTVPESRVVSPQNFSNPDTAVGTRSYNGWGLHWWDIGTDKGER